MKDDLTTRQRKYVEHRVAGMDRLEAAKAVGFTNPSLQSSRQEVNPKIIQAMALLKARQMLPAALVPAPEPQLPVTSPAVPSAPVPAQPQTIDLRNTWAPQPIPLVTPLSREELISALTNVVRNLDESLQSRILASKLLCDLSGWLDPSKRSGDVFIRLGDTEKNL